MQKLVLLIQIFIATSKNVINTRKGFHFEAQFRLRLVMMIDIKVVQSISKNEACSIVSLQIADKSRVRLIFADKSHRHLLAVSSVMRSMLFLSSCCGPVGVLDKRKFGLLSCH